MSTIPAPGDFSFVQDTQTREMFDDAYHAITVAEAWDAMRSGPGEGGYMFSDFPKREAINANIKYWGHSGASYGMTLRQMQLLARIGWERFVLQWVE